MKLFSGVLCSESQSYHGSIDGRHNHLDSPIRNNLLPRLLSLCRAFTYLSVTMRLKRFLLLCKCYSKLLEAPWNSLHRTFTQYKYSLHGQEASFLRLLKPCFLWQDFKKWSFSEHRSEIPKHQFSYIYKLWYEVT